MKSRKTENDVKPGLHQDVKPGLHYKYPVEEYSLDRTKDTLRPEKSLIIKDEALKGGFSQIPNIILRNPSLTGNEKCVYCLLLSYAWQDKECFPGQDTLATDMGISRVSINQLLHKLRKKRLISWKRRGLGKCNIYFIERIGIKGTYDHGGVI